MNPDLYQKLSRFLWVRREAVGSGSLEFFRAHGDFRQYGFRRLWRWDAEGREGYVPMTYEQSCLAYRDTR